MPALLRQYKDFQAKWGHAAAAYALRFERVHGKLLCGGSVDAAQPATGGEGVQIWRASRKVRRARGAVAAESTQSFVHKDDLVGLLGMHLHKQHVVLYAKAFKVLQQLKRGQFYPIEFGADE